MPGLSVIVATYRREQKLLRCLRSLVEAERPREPLEILVVDDGGGLSAYLERGFPQLPLRVVRLTDNLGQPGAQWRGVQESTGDILAFLDDDAVVSHEWLATIVRIFRTCPDVAAALGRIEPLDRTRLLARTRQGIYDRRHARYLDRGFVRELIARYGLHVDRETGLSDHISGGNFAMRRTTLYDLGGFPAHLRLGCDEYLSRRLLESRNAIAYEPAMMIRHDHNTSYRTLFWTNFREGRDRARVRMDSGRSWPAALFESGRDLLRTAANVHGSPEILAADPVRAKVYLVFGAVQVVDTCGQVYEVCARQLRS